MGLLGAAAGYLVPRGQGRRWILGSMMAVVLFGVAQSAAGLVALAGGQPYAIWYPLLLCGVIFTLVVGGLYPAMRRGYAAAEQRRLDARAIRNG